MDLLEKLSGLLDCQYLSDLPHASANTDQGEAILGLSETRYSLEEYNKAAQYLLMGGEATFATAREAKEAILKHLMENHPKA